jgi:glycosyltransferase involved in cell wall biosynthesis
MGQALGPASSVRDGERGLSSERPINVLAFSALYPNREMPFHGVFVENRLRRLIETGEVAALAVAPVPWFPLASRRFGRYATFARVPREERRHGITVLHPRYASIPKVGMSAAPVLMYRSLKTCLHAILHQRFAFDVIDAHYFYPDGVAAALLGRSLGKPVMITARGTDVNLIPDHLLPRRWIRWAAERAAGIVAVSEALRTRLIELGVPGARIQVLRNGVDLDLFAPRDREAARREAGLDVDAAIVLSVGLLVPLKGHDLVIRALAGLPEAILVIVGEGPQAGRLRRLAERLELGERVRFLGAMPQERLATLYSAADVAVLASSREGLPNVLLEALACGTPVVATAVWGTPEIVAAPIAGRLVEERTPEALRAAIRGLLADPPARAAVRAYALRFGWGPTTAGQLRMFRSILNRPA